MFVTEAYRNMVNAKTGATVQHRYASKQDRCHQTMCQPNVTYVAWELWRHQQQEPCAVRFAAQNLLLGQQKLQMRNIFYVRWPNYTGRRPASVLLESGVERARNLLTGGPIEPLRSIGKWWMSMITFFSLVFSSPSTAVVVIGTWSRGSCAVFSDTKSVVRT